MSESRLIELSHPIESGMQTYPGLPAPEVCDYWTREDSASHYAEGTSFHIARVTLVGNTGTYVDVPFHRFVRGADLAEVELDRLADLPGIVVRSGGESCIDVAAFDDLEVAGCAVLVNTGWSRHWGSEAYFHGHPWVTAAAAEWLRDSGAALVGIDSLNIDDTAGDARPVHSTLLGAGIPIVEHMRGLEELPDSGFRFHAVPAPFRGVGSFPVRAYACL
ncbi:MAG: cyclase family protein [Gammaproteobacteria bacterium]|jgi:kynurenine formamidase